ncbi:Metallo-dependent phosphatase-like protein [Cladochytrium replicatum]|nr:Metallo-dependent phosphatase-like protein [Cladochytrium replicatum]
MLVLVIGDFHIPHRALELPPKFKKLLVPGKIQQILCTGNLCNREILGYLRTVASDVNLVKGDMDESLPAGTPSMRVVQHGPLKIGVLHGHQVVPQGDVQALSILARQMDVDVLVSGNTHRFEAFEYEGRFFVNPGSATGAFSPAMPVLPPLSAVQSKAAPETSAETKAAKTEAKKEVAPSEDGTVPEEEDEETEAVDENEEPKEAEAADPSENEEEARAAAVAEAVARANGAVETSPSFVLMDIQGATIVMYVYQLVGGEVKVEKLDYTKRF